MTWLLARLDIRLRVDSHRLLLLVATVGLMLQFAAWMRQGAGPDQRTLLLLGGSLVSGGGLGLVGKPMTTGFEIPSVLQQLFVGLPLAVWNDYRAPSLVVLVFHVAAIAILFRTARSLAGTRFALALVAVLWFCPWRVFHSGTLWEPNYLLLPAAIHFWGCVESRDAPRFAASFVLAFSAVLFSQLHPSAVVLFAFWLILVVRGHVYLSVPGATAGGALALIPALPALFGGRVAPATMPLLSEYGLGSTLGLATLNLPKTLLYWARLPSPDVGDRLLQVSVKIAEAAGGSEGAGLGHRIGIGIMIVATFAMLAQARTACAFVGRGPRAVHPSSRSWLRSYFLAGMGASLLCALFVPFAVQGWYLLGVLPAACMPLADAICTARLGRRPRAAAVLTAVVALNALVSLLLVLWHPVYNPPQPALTVQAITASCDSRFIEERRRAAASSGAARARDARVAECPAAPNDQRGRPTNARPSRWGVRCVPSSDRRSSASSTPSTRSSSSPLVPHRWRDRRGAAGPGGGERPARHRAAARDRHRQRSQPLPDAVDGAPGTRADAASGGP